MLIELIKDLQQVGLDTTAEELADILWLAVHVQEKNTVQPATAADQATSTLPEAQATTVESTLREPEPADTPEHSAPTTKTVEPQASAPGPGGELFLPNAAGDAEGTSSWGGEPFRAPAAPSLPGKLALTRALRPLKRRINSRLRQELDIAETVRLSAESQTIMPVGKPTRIRWLDLILVVDEWSSMVIWQQTITELRHLLGQQGAFRNIIMLGLGTDPTSALVQLHSGVGPGAQRQRGRKAKELIDPAGETLILVLSDCVSPAWYNGQVTAMLKLWSGRVGKLALVQMLPERLWNRTALRSWLDAPLRARQAGLPNQNLEVTWPRRWRRQEKPQNVLKLPVITLEPESLQQWAQSVAGNGNLWVSGRMLLLEQNAAMPLQAALSTTKRPAPKHQDPLEKLEQFWSNASPIARKLAGYLAAAPLSLPTMWLVQQVMVKEARQVHLAEVFLSGLLRQTRSNPGKDPADFRYDFLNEEIRKRLLAAVDVTDRLEILNQVTSFIDSRTGQSMSFQAILAQPSVTDHVALSKSNQPFAAIAAVVLESMGRTFAPLAERFRKLEQGQLVAGYQHEQPTQAVDDEKDSDSADSPTANAPTVGKESQFSGQYYALLIGIDHYFEYRLPGGVYYPKLGGCVRDVNMVYQFLTERINIAPSKIIKLTATLGGAQPKEELRHWPTYTNMVNAFNEITNVAQAGDHLYIQYSGHGGRTTTMFPTIKGEGEFDEGLVPLDIGKKDDPTARYLRDVELHELLQRIVAKGIRLTVVFDCDHSGSATIYHSGMEVNGYTFFAACRTNESTFEYPFNGRESNGALTYWLLDTLRNASPNYTWKMVADRVTAKVHGQFAAQTPMLQGEIDYRIFSHERVANRFAIAVLEVDPTLSRVRLNAGEAHGLSKGTQFAIYPVGTMQYDNPGRAVATLELTEVLEVEAWGKVMNGNISTIEAGAQAIIIGYIDVKSTRKVSVGIDNTELRQQVESAIRELGKGFLTIAESHTMDFIVLVKDSNFVIADSNSQPLPNLRPMLQVDNTDAIEKLVKRLIHLVKYYNVAHIDMFEPSTRSMLSVEMTTSSNIVQLGEQVVFKITNTQTPNSGNPNDPERVLNVTILMLSSDWTIWQIYPQNAAFESVGPSKSIELEIDAYLAQGEIDGFNIFKIFATRQTTDFRWLALPGLDRLSLTGIPMQVPAVEVLDPLQSEAINKETTTLPNSPNESSSTRKGFRLTKASSPAKGWTTDEMKISVQRTETQGVTNEYRSASR